MFIVFATIIAISAAAPDRLAEKLIITNNYQDKNSSSICKTPVCVQEASTILRKMEPTVNPCNNFYQFACGKFVNETVIPDDASEVTVFSSIRHKLKNQLLLSLSDKIKKDDLPVFQVMKSFYQTCMDTEKILKNTENELKEVLKKLGGWPILNGLSWNETNFDWEKFVYESGQMGYDTFFFLNIYVDTDSNATSKRIIEIDCPEMGITPEILSDDNNYPVIEAYGKFMDKVALILGAKHEEAKEDYQNLIEFEQKLMHICQTSTRIQYRMTVSNLEMKYPNISWMKYINWILAPYAHVDENEEVIVYSPEFLEAFSALITTTPNRILANYGMWRIIRQSISRTEGRLADASAEFSSTMFGKRTQVPRSETCFTFVNEYFLTAVGSLYVRLYYDKKAQTKVGSLIKNIRASLHDMIEQANWMDNKTKKRALEKLGAMGEYIGYPDELMDDEKLNEYYKNLTIHPESFFKFRFGLNKFRREQPFLYLRKTVNDNKWMAHSEAHNSNAFYYQLENLIDIRAGILQEEFFHIARPNYMNYGAIGWIIGHEMTHAFDSYGSWHDKYGNLANWWESETRKTYSKKVECIIKQYSNYTVKDINMTINGDKSKSENLADNGGLKAAYYAYNKWAETNDVEPQLPGLDYTPQQMFWISAATSRCEKIKSKYLESLVRSDEHDPMEIRVIGSMSNMPEFSKDFNCPPESPMNPNKKCTVW